MNRFCCAFLLLLPLPASAQYLYQHLTIRDGLAQGSVYFMLKDSRGFVWFSTQAGLNRYDGKNFAVYTHRTNDPHSPEGYMGNGLAETPGGDIWFGTERCLNRYHRDRDRFSHVFARDSQGRSVGSLTHVIDADSAEVWYNNSVEGIVSYNYHTGRRTRRLTSATYEATFENEYIKRSPARSELWILLHEGILRHNYQTGQSTYFFTRRPDNAAGLPTAFTAQWLQPDGTLFLASASGLVRFRPATGEIRQYPVPGGFSQSPVFDLEADYTDNLWLATGGSGIWIFNMVLQRWTQHLVHNPYDQNSLASNEIVTLLIDREGIVWANADPVGVDKLVPDRYRIQHYRQNPFVANSLSDNSTRGYTEDRYGRIWIGSVQGGLNVLDPKTHRIVRCYRATTRPGRQQAGQLPADEVGFTYNDRKNRLWICTRAGLCRYDESTDSFRRINNPIQPTVAASNDVQSIIELPSGRMVLTTQAGLYGFDPDRLTFTLLANPVERYTSALAYDIRTKRLLAGRWLEGIECYQLTEKTVPTAQLLYHQLPGINVLAIHPDQARRCLWVATGAGVFKLHPGTGQTIRQFQEKDGLPHRVVYCTAPARDGLLWMSTNRGVATLNPDTGVITLIQAIAPDEYNRAAYYTARNGDLYLGSNTGLYRFNPARLTPRRHTIRVYLSGLTINDIPARPDSNLTELRHLSLSPDQTTFSLAYAALDFHSNGDNRYQYRLVGLDTGWVDAGSATRVRYTRLMPGHYTFAVRAADINGFWTSQTRQLTVFVRPAFYQTTWFWVLATLLVLGVGFGGVRVYTRRQRASLQRMLVVQEEERQRIAADLHDDLGGTLSAIKGKLESLNTAPESLAEPILLMEKAIRDLRLISHDLMPPEFAHLSLREALAEAVKRAESTSPSQFLLICYGHERRLATEVELTIYRMASELITNAVKHAKSSYIHVQLIYFPEYVTLLVEDDGVGHPAEPANGGIGLRNLRSRANYLNARLSIDSGERGTTAMLEVPH